MAAHVRLKNEFTEDEKCHNLMSWLNGYRFGTIRSFGIVLLRVDFRQCNVALDIRVWHGTPTTLQYNEVGRKRVYSGKCLGVALQLFLPASMLSIRKEYFNFINHIAAYTMLISTKFWICPYNFCKYRIYCKFRKFGDVEMACPLVTMYAKYIQYCEKRR